MLEKSALSDTIDSILQDEARITAALIPGPLTEQALARLRVEAVRRVWASADVHALALVAMLARDYDAARLWTAYLDTAMNRDKRMLAELSLDEAQVRAIPPLRATIAMFETIARNVGSFGPIPAVAYAIFVEWSARHETEHARLFDPGVGKRDEHLAKLIEVAQRLITQQPYVLGLFIALLRQASAFMRTSITEAQGLVGTQIGQPSQPDAPAPKGG